MPGETFTDQEVASGTPKHLSWFGFIPALGATFSLLGQSAAQPQSRQFTYSPCLHSPVCTPYLTPTHLEMRLTAPWAVRGGKNSRENHLSPESILRFIFSRSLSHRSGSNPGVEHLELSLELSLPLLLPSQRGPGPPFPLGSFTMAEFLLHGGGGEGRGRETEGQVAEPQRGRVR